jgi:hypothetical protein
MSNAARITMLAALGLGMWALATLYIHFLPTAFTSPIHSAMSFITAVPIGWLSVRFVRRCARLARSQLVAGTAWVAAVAMTIDGLALRFFPWVYSTDLAVFRPASAWLLWGYGVSLAMALRMGREIRHMEAQALVTRISRAAD